ncbi:glycoside hydrolase family 32 protein [Halalkalibacter kiskunsagensis]|uniref:Sucrose-6-phosphate hydrolase n=1 Tax=Halalkalibacter kiskunsagensis TaxID=1548599 RepID=A0ABV6KBK1_9BACI
MKNLDHQELIKQAELSIGHVKDMVNSDIYRMGYHFMSPANWINDPNGLIYFNGEYHLFYQYHPYSPEWGPMHWGHAKSKDLVYWEHLPIALAPSEEYDSGGCFSGCAVIIDDKLMLIYTGNTYLEDGSRKQVQCIAESKDGIHFQKFEGNPIISDPPLDGTMEFRDPNVWKHKESWYMIVGSGKDGKGKALLYKSINLFDWDYMGYVIESDGSQGQMWECPDLFPLGEKHVLIISPIYDDKTRNTIYMIGHMNYETCKFTPEFTGVFDYGFDNYAAQSLLDDQGRRIVFGWMDHWGSYLPTKENGWAGAMTLPRVLNLLPDGKLSIKPVPELSLLREKHYKYLHLKVTDKPTSLLGNIVGDCLEIMAEIDFVNCTAEEFGIKLKCPEGNYEQKIVTFNTFAGQIIVNRTMSNKGDSSISYSKIRNNLESLKIHLFIDKSSIELFIDDGRVTLSNRIYPSKNRLEVDLFAKNGSVNIKLMEIWKLKSIW